MGVLNGGSRIAAAALVLWLLAACASSSNSNTSSSAAAATAVDPQQTAHKARMYYNQLANDMMIELASWPRQNPYMGQASMPRQSAFQARLATAGLGLQGARYGLFCGDNNPGGLNTVARVSETHKEGVDRRFENIQTLRRAGQPVDAIDQICFAHDVCYETVGRDSDACDFPMVLAMLHTARAMERTAQISGGQTERACANLAWDLTLAYMLKPRSGSTDDQGNKAVRTYALYQSLQATDPGFPSDKLSSQRSYGYPASGQTCQLPAGVGSTPHDAVTLFSEFVNVRPLQDALRSDASVQQLAASPRHYDAHVDSKVEFSVCSIQAGGSGNDCWDSDWALMLKSWTGLKRKVETEAQALMSLVAEGGSLTVAASSGHPSTSTPTPHSQIALGGG